MYKVVHNIFVAWPGVVRSLGHINILEFPTCMSDTYTFVCEIKYSAYLKKHVSTIVHDENLKAAAAVKGCLGSCVYILGHSSRVILSECPYPMSSPSCVWQGTTFFVAYTVGEYDMGGILSSQNARLYFKLYYCTNTTVE